MQPGIAGSSLLVLLTVGPTSATERPSLVPGRPSPEHAAVFAPVRRADRFHFYVSDLSIEHVAALLAQRLPEGVPSFQIRPGSALDAFDNQAPFDRYRLARLFGGSRPRIARGPLFRDAGDRQPIAAVLLMSPYPEPDLVRLNAGTLIMVVDVPSPTTAVLDPDRPWMYKHLRFETLFHIMERMTSVEKALEICEALSVSGRGLTVGELSRALRQPAPTVHRLLAVLKRRGYVRQDEETTRYSLTLKMLDLSFRLLGRSELRLHAYPVVREHVVRTGQRAFVAVPSVGEVTYIWSAGPDEVATYTAYGREMPGHCAIFFPGTGERSGGRRLSCLRMAQPQDAAAPEEVTVRLGPETGTADSLRLVCACAPVSDYTGREVARVGLFAHGDERAFHATAPGAAWELAGHISSRLGYLPASTAIAYGRKHLT